MTSKFDSPFDGQSDTQSILSSEFDQYHRTKNQFSPKKNFVTPTKKKKINKKIIDQQSILMTNRTRTVYHNSKKKNSKQKKQIKDKLTKKYPKQVVNKKLGTVTIANKKGQTSNFQNVCPICLDPYSNIKGMLKCGHKFCDQCIQQWIKTSTKCPCCRAMFSYYTKITISKQKNLQLKRQIIQVQQKVMEFNQTDHYVCYQCRTGQDDDVLLICDMCDYYCCHVYCDPALKNRMPRRQWFCKYCIQVLKNSQKDVRRVENRVITQTIIQSQRISTQTTRTISVYCQNNSDSQEQEENPQRLSKQKISGSKALQVTNRNSSQSQNSFRQVISRNTRNSTAINLRNLRRRILME